jgi:sugar phosphate isomerase/epimerase
LFDFVDDCAKFGLEGTELTSYYFPSDVTSDYLRRLKGHCFRLGLDVSGTAVGNDFGHPEGPERDEQLQRVKRWVDHAELLGAPVIRIFAGHAHGDASPEELHRRIVSGIEECCQYAGEHGVYLALENHGGPTATGDGLLALVRDVQSPWFGVNLDTGNFQGDDVYGDLQRAAPYAINVQVKVSISNGGGGRQPTDHRRLAELLQLAHYRGYIALEFEEAGDPRSECPRHLDAIRTAFGH